MRDYKSWIALLTGSLLVAVVTLSAFNLILWILEFEAPLLRTSKAVFILAPLAFLVFVVNFQRLAALDNNWIAGLKNPTMKAVAVFFVVYFLFVTSIILLPFFIEDDFYGSKLEASQIALQKIFSLLFLAPPFLLVSSKLRHWFSK